MTIEVGDSVPAFDLPTDGGGRMSQDDLKGKATILYFYPKDDTPGCTKEACSFRDMLPDFSGSGAQVVGVSRDSVKKHDNFKAKYELPFTLISDEENTLIEAFGVWKEKNMYGKKVMGVERSTFLIDAEGVVRQVWRGVKVPGHAEAVLEAARAL